MCLFCSIFHAGIRRYIANTSMPIPDDLDHLLSFFCTEKTPWILIAFPTLGIEKQVPKTTSSDESFSWVMQKLDHCKDNHPDCVSYLSTAVLPKRVVFVGTVTEPALRLYESQGESDPYTCLSYCWGHRPFLRTLVSNFESHKTCIEPKHLPPTFNDAIDYTRRLGVQYIWIDSLCIVQDSLDDWREEAGKMTSIFHNAFLVLSATGSADAYGGLYASFPSDFETLAVRVDTRTNRVLTSEEVDADPTLHKTETIYVRRAFSHVQVDILDRRLKTAPLLPTLRRGWIFQERFLSARVLHFGPQELYFECLGNCACQCTHGNIEERISWTWEERDTHTDSHTFHNQISKTYFSPSLWRRMDHDALVTVWHTLVRDYKKLELTYEKDLFPAISGLAREMSIARAAKYADSEMGKRSGYFAGLWRDSLIRDLCWHLDRFSLPNLALRSTGKVTMAQGLRSWKERPCDWRAPTWSWGSVNASVVFIGSPTDIHKDMCEVLDVSCTTAGSDEMGEITGGKLVLRGQILRATVKRSRFISKQEPLPWEVLDLDMQGLPEFWQQEVYVDDGCEDLLRLLDEEKRPDDDRLTVYCFLLAKVAIGRQDRAVFLMLKKVKGASGGETGQGVYQRFGMFELTEPPRRGEQVPKATWEERFKVLAHAKEEVVTII
ncbi:heterokaryon incompatibility protein-domain-containing protein [Sordaria brevicollis]|uniref:Heterokaryon incompatibility protein-domain-containing protein n=1 Tax=Sordaria brevicollis TaxID=83679 RepID=A0AAE0PBE5_SORBR|nr:heterokaryon incompatibility protein-domain-containing protein [Sordaria brevicollis]